MVASPAMPPAAIVPRSALQAAAPPRICFPFGGGAVGGSHISAVKLIQRLDRSQVHPLIVLHHGSGELGRFLKGEGLDYLTLNDALFFGTSAGLTKPRGAGAVWRTCADQWRLAHFLKSHDVRIVHTNEGAMHVSWALPARLAGAKQVWHHRGSSDARGVRFLAPVVASHIIGVSEFALSAVRPIPGAARKTAVVYSPFDVDAEPIDRQEAHAALTTELGVDPETRLIGFFGNLVERKRPQLFIDMIAQMAGMRPDLPFMGLLFGAALQSGVKEMLEDHARSVGVADRVRLMGFRYGSARLMAGCDVHAVPSIDEPFGRSLIEAMLLGTPVIAAESGGNREAIEQGVTGLLTAPDNPTAMAAAIVDLLESPHRHKAIAARARETARHRYSTERHIAEVSAIYQSLLGHAAQGATGHGQH
ncbi:glycosyltransferase family 4 protein [Sphingobium bisphenolivorans]|uniref:glycosyltransferase family 4 protein n=1 Tax=Sphingobium bisphenolivorans TaxID=1335760 RepID=UPI0003AA985E|nr:glycosyltransferase family 4 protein [Sphingobium bisphenolivorans]